MSSSASYTDRSLQKEMRAFRKSELVLQFANMLVFGMSLVLFVIGLLYLTVYYYEYSFTVLSINLFAGFYITIGVILFFCALFCIFLLKPDGHPLVVGTYVLTIIIAFLVLLILGAVGLGMKSSNELFYETQSQMQNTMRDYDPRNQYKYQTKKVNWLQKRFSCCGINTFADWKSIMYSGGYGFGDVKYMDKYNYENKMAYSEDVPDSCCINMMPNCGRQMVSVVGGGIRERSHMIYTSGCLAIYYKYFSYDITFLGALSICISVVLLIGALVLIYGYLLSKNVIAYGQANNRARGANTSNADDDEEDLKPSKRLIYSDVPAKIVNTNAPRPATNKVQTNNINQALYNNNNNNSGAAKPSSTTNNYHNIPIAYSGTAAKSTDSAGSSNKNLTKSPAPPVTRNYNENTNYSRSPNVGNYYTSRLNY